LNFAGLHTSCLRTREPITGSMRQIISGPGEGPDPSATDAPETAADWGGDWQAAATAKASRAVLDFKIMGLPFRNPELQTKIHARRPKTKEISSTLLDAAVSVKIRTAPDASQSMHAPICSPPRLK